MVSKYILCSYIRNRVGRPLCATDFSAYRKHRRTQVLHFINKAHHKTLHIIKIKIIIMLHMKMRGCIIKRINEFHHDAVFKSWHSFFKEFKCMHVNLYVYIYKISSFLLLYLHWGCGLFKRSVSDVHLFPRFEKKFFGTYLHCERATKAQNFI